MPPEVLTGAGLPALLPSTWNWTVPVGVPAPGAVAEIVAVKVTDWPKTEGFADELTAVPVLAMFTVCVKSAEVLALKLLLPL